MRDSMDAIALIAALLILVALMLLLSNYQEELAEFVHPHTEKEQDAPYSRGMLMARSCVPCHDMTERASLGYVGPPLWGIVGKPMGVQAGYAFSKAHLQRVAKAGCLIWSEARLDEYLRNPRDYLPGNRMAFAGLRNDQDRLVLITYLKTLRDEPSDALNRTLRQQHGCPVEQAGDAKDAGRMATSSAALAPAEASRKPASPQDNQ